RPIRGSRWNPERHLGERLGHLARDGAEDVAAERWRHSQDHVLRTRVDERASLLQRSSSVGCRSAAADLRTEGEAGRIPSSRFERAEHGIALLDEVPNLAG